MPDDPSTSAVLGVDACPGGWVGIRLRSGDPGVPDTSPQGFFGPTLEALAAAAGPVKVVGIDIPLGFADDTDRAPDVLAKRLVGPRRSSVFMTPPRPALLAPSRSEADVISRALTGKGVSAQAFALAAKVIEANAWAPGHPARVVEVHPEVSFATLAGRFLEPKRSWAGARRRHGLLEAAGIRIPHELGEAGVRAGVDDVLDAAVAAWSASRVLAGTAVSHPDPPVTYADGWPCAVWA